MPIDSKSYSTNVATGYTTNNFSQSNSFHSLRLSSSQSLSSSAKFIVRGSKSSNCLSNDDELIENDELIDKLFPKCRPKSKVTSPSAVAKLDNKLGYVKKLALIEPNNSNPNNSKNSRLVNNREMLNASDVSNSSSSSAAAASNNITNITNNSDVIINGTNYADSSTSASVNTATRKNFQRLQTRRIWNFMDISPSPSPPPLSPIEDSYDTVNSHNTFTSANCLTSDSTGDKYLLYQPPPPAPPAETSAEPKLNVTNHIQDNNNSSSSSSQNYNNYANRNSFKMKGKFDINSLELNQTTTATSTTAVKNAAPEVVPAANVIKRSYSNLNNEPQDVHNVRQPPIVNHKQAGAHFRLDSLLLSPDECADVSGGSSRLSNGIKKANRFTLDYDLNDEDDVLFSRLNHPSTAVSSAIGFNLPLLHQVSKQYSSNNKEINNSYPLGDKSNELASTSTSSSSTMTKKSSGQDLTKLKSKLSYNEMDECRSIDFNNKSVTTKVNTEAAVVADDNDEDVETCRDLSINGNRLNDNNFNRNRIELAGGKEIFSSSRSTRAKRRSNCHNSGSQPQGSGLSGTTSAPSTSTGTNQSVNQRNGGGYCQRQIQLYSVSMATTPSAASAVNATCVSSDMDANVNNVNNNSQLQGQLTETAVAQLQSTLVTAAADNDDIACCDGSEEKKQVLDIIADSNKYNTYSAKVIDSKVHSANNNSQFPVVVKTTPKEEINELDNDNSSFRPKELKNLQQQQQQRLLQKVCPPTEINRDQSIESNDHSSTTTTATVISGDSLHFNASIAMENKINYSSQPNKSTSKPIFGEDDSVEDDNEDDDEDEDDGGVEDEDDDHDVATAGGDRAFKSKLYNEIDYEESLIREIDEVLEKPSFLRQFTLSSVSTENANLPKDSDLEIVNNNNKKQPCIRKQEQDNKSSLNYSTDPFIRDLHQKLDMVSTINNKNNNNSSQTIVEQKSFANVESEKVESEMETEIESDNNSIKSISLSQKSFDADERIARVIGSVPIAQYEGSPKRYGPKPGYPRRVLSTSSATDSHDYETIPINKSDLLCADEIQPKSLSPENGSPNSTSSSSSATFSSTDIHSSSSFSCPNQKYNGFSNWNIQSRINENRYDDRPPPPPNDDCNSVCDEECKQSQSRSAQRKDSIVMNQGKISCDDIVKSILSIPSGHQVDTEDDGDDNLTTIPGLAKSSHSQTQIEPVYSSLNFIQDQIRPSECDLRYSTTTTTINNPNSKLHSCLSDEKQAVNAATATTTASSNGCDQSTTSLKATNFYQNDLSAGERVVTQIDSSNKQQPPPPNSISNSTSMDRNIPKSLALSNYSRYSQASQSFESTDSSYRSEKYNSKEYYYANSEEEDTYIYDQKNYPMKQTLVGTNNNTNANNNNGSRLNGDPNKSSTQTGLIGYSCLSPELNANNAQSMPKMFTDLTYESPGYHSSDQGEIYSDSLANEKSDSASVPGGGVRLVSTMPVLEDGLSSGMPSSDEMDYDDEDDDGDDLARHEHDLDDYVKEYNNNNRQTVSGCDTSVQAANRLLNMVNGTGSGYGYQLKGDKSDNTNNQHSSSYRCATKDQYGHELAEDIVHQASHHHSHLNPHVHNHPILGETLRQNLSPYENNSKPDLATSSGSSSSGQDVANISNYNKFCLSSQLRSSSLSNTSSNTSSVSTVRNNSSHLGQQNDAKPPPHGSTSQDSVGLSPQHSHHHYHHYYHQQQQQHSNSSQANSNRHNYPNLSSSPTSMSPNSPGTLQPINASSGSSGSSSSSSHIPPSVLSQHHPPPPPPPPPQPPNSSKLAASSSQIPSQSTEMPVTNSPSSSAVPGTAAPNVRHHHDEDCDTDQETDRLLGAQRNDERGFYENEKTPVKRSSTSREGFEPQVLIEGVLFRARYLGSTQLVCDGQPTKATRMMQAEEAVSRIKAPEGETQPSTEVDLFISTEKIMVLNTDLKEIMMDHALRTISYIADIGDLLVLMARRRTPLDDPTDTGIKRIPKMICHVFESEEAQYIAQSIGQAFQVAYMEFLKANGIEDSSFLKEMDYQEVLNSQEIFGNELEMFAKRERQKEVIVPKQKGEILGIVIVESGWGSMLPTVVIANMAQSSPSARCGQLNIGDQIIAINGISLVGLPLSTCQAYVKNTKNQTAVKFTIVPCAPVVEVKIKRPDTKYQLGFSVQNGVICSLLRGGIAERGGVRVGHRIIEINGQSVVAVPHDRIVNLLATSVGEIHMKTMPTSMFRLLTGQESPSFM